MLGQQRPLTGTLRLTARRTAYGLDRNLAHAIIGHGLFIENWLFVGFKALVRVIERHHGQAVPITPLATGILDSPVAKDLGAAVGVSRILWHVSVNDDLAAIPESQAMEDRSQVLQHRPALGLLLQVEVAGKARLLATLPVRHQLVAVLCDAVQGPTVDHAGIDALAQTVVRMQRQVVEDPGRVVGVRLFVGAVPNPVAGAGTASGIGPGLRVIVHRHPHDTASHQGGHLGNITAELLGVVLQTANRCQRVFLIAVDNFGDGLHHHAILHERAVGLWCQAPSTDRPAATGWQLNAVRALVLGNVLAVDLGCQHLQIGAAVGRHIHRILNAHTVDIAAAVLRLQLWPAQAQAHSIDH
ncbi:hypothetical protein D3C77_272840 [compost metagenome]